MKVKSSMRLRAASVLGLAFAALAAAQSDDPCRVAQYDYNKLVGAFGVKVNTLKPLTAGGNYVSGSDRSLKAYPTYLYPGNSNEIPASHRAKGEALAATIQPLNASGLVDVNNGKIVMIAEGMSNTRSEMETFDSLLTVNLATLHPKLEFRNLAQGGCDLVCWAAKPVGAIDPQVQIALIKHSNNRAQNADGSPQIEIGPFTTRESKSFPAHAQTTNAMLKQRILNLKKQYPNLKLVFLTSRTFGGWSCAPAGDEYHEPVGFEEGFAVQWLIRDQILGADPDLAFEGSNAKAPWLAWGPYLWDASWPENYFKADGTHPCDAGKLAAAQKWYGFLKQESLAKSWFLKGAPSAVENAGALPPSDYALAQNFPNPFYAQTEIVFQTQTREAVTISIHTLEGRKVRALFGGMAAPGLHRVQWNGRDENDREVAAGVYLYRLQTPRTSLTKKLVLMR